MKRSVYTIPGKNYIVPTNHIELMGYLDKQRPTFTCLYFHANWNPICESVNEDYDRFTANNSTFTHIKVDCDATPKVKFFFDARVEPQFIMLLNGAEIKRQIGFNFNLVENHLESITNYHFSEASYIGESGDQWERFYDSFDRWQKDGEYDRDAMRMNIDSIADTHRGPGAL